MRSTLITLLLLCVVGTTQTFGQGKSDAVLGEWLSAKKDTRFLIYKQGNTFFGKILWGSDAITKDSKNPDPKLQSRDLVGLTMLNNFVFEGGNTWSDGTIYDPREGKTYSCKLTLKSPDQLSVRGYVGVALFGRTETWTRFAAGKQP